MFTILLQSEPEKNCDALVPKDPTYHDAHIRAVRGRGKNPAALYLTFTTGGPERKRSFSGVIDFWSLAKEMMDTDPEAAIKAFGSVMQDVSLAPKPKQAPHTVQVATQTADDAQQ
jgi:hypothetical protein